VTTGMASQKRDPASFEASKYIGIRRCPKRRVYLYLADIGEAGHRVEPTASDDSYLCLRHEKLLNRLSKLAIIQDSDSAAGTLDACRGKKIFYNLSMRTVVIALFLSFLCSAQQKPLTVPITVDHNRIIVDVYLLLADGTKKRVRGWFDNGNPDFWVDERVSQLLGLEYTSKPTPNNSSGAKTRNATVPKQIFVGDFPLSLTGLKETKVVLADSIGPGLSAEINLPSTLLRNYDVLVDFPNRELTLAPSGGLRFVGLQSKVFINETNGLIQVPSKIDGKSYNFALDLGSSTSFIAPEVLTRLTSKHKDWPQMTGAIGNANLWGLPDEPQWTITRLARLQFGSAFLTDVAMVAFSPDTMKWFSQRAGIETAGLIGSNALLNQRIGIAYSKKLVFLEIGSAFKAPDMDVIGVVLRPEADGNYRILGVAEYDGQPSVPDVKTGDLLVAVDRTPAKGSTMGQIWSLLSGRPGDTRVLTLERDGKQFTVKAPVHRFLEASQRKEEPHGRTIAPLPPRRP
jgi:hypothetical protein